MRQGKLGQEGNGALTGTAQIAAHADRTIERPIHQRTAVETVCDQLMRRLALRAAIRPITTGIGNLFLVLLDGPGEGV